MFNPETLQSMLHDWGWVAYIILFIIVFAETGLLVGFCLPGDSLLFIAGFVCSPAAGNIMDPWLLGFLLIVAAVVGDTVGYWLGWKTGPMIFHREDSIFFHRKHLIKTQKFYEKYGGRTIIYARFVPIVRTFAPFVAGVGKMEYKRFISYNVFGGIGWVVSMLALGYFLGNIPWVKHNLEKAVIIVIFISILPIIIEVAKARFGKPTPESDPPAVLPTEPSE
ncbi:MAG: VTT domain-containing protein [Candidatus Sumerlaeaceae bacterium]|nr:VTT domain-containing protein [Candidatus Sumerlaeaceae bacterium]